MKKKFMSLFLSILMVFSVMPNYVALADTASCDHIFTEETLPDDDNVFWETHSKDDYFVGSKAFISAELPAGCESDGWYLDASDTTGFCMICGDFITEDDKVTVKATGHNMVEDEELAVAPTCEDDGEKTYTCSNENYEIVVELDSTTGLYKANALHTPCPHTETKVVEALGHSYTDYVANEDEDCVNDGTETAECDNGCGSSDTRVIPDSALGHDYVAVEVVEPTCTEDGFTTYECSRCGDSYEDDVTDALEHDYQAVHTVDPTCINKGYTTYECSHCGDAYVDDIVDELGHDFQAVNTVEPTCTEDGYTTYECSRCGESYDSDFVDALDHDYIETVIQEATCANGGIQGVKKITCSRCDYAEYVYTDAPEHIGDDPEIIEATCTNTGIEKGICKVCGEDYVIVTPRLPHVFEIETTEPTCTEDGLTKNTCVNCGQQFIVDFKEAIGHSFTNYVSNNDATCTEDGTKTAVCDNGCGETDTIADEGSALGHDIETTVVDPTCTEKGYTKDVCVRDGCDYEKIYDEVPATGHSFTNYVSNNDATCTEDGTKTAVCDNGCGETDTIADEGSALGHDIETTVVDPTCTEKGYTKDVCVRDGCDYEEIYDEVPALGHHIVLQKDSSYKPHCDTAGRNVYVCDRCGDYSFIEYLAPLGHEINEETYVETSSDCLHGNTIEYDCCRVVEEYDGSTWACDEHIFTEDDERNDSIEFTENVTADAAHKNSYYVEGNSFDPETDVLSTGHDYEWTYVEATCEFDAYWTGTCVRTRTLEDGTVVSCPENDEIMNSPVTVVCRNTAIGHRWALLDDNSAKQPTCTEDGVRCYMCLNDHAHTYTEKLPATGHNFRLVDSIDATCTEGAYDLYECQNGDCTESYKQYTSAPIAHNYVVTDKVAATCTEEGYEVYTCEMCGEATYTKTTTPATGHNYVVTDSVSATCVSEGYDIYTCTNCGDTYNKTTTHATGHCFVVDSYTEPTCTTYGYATYVCINKDCTETYNADFVSAKGHHYVADVTVPTCTEEGYTTYTCDVCGEARKTADGEIYKSNITLPVGHVYNAVNTVKATCTTDGAVTYECVNCGYQSVKVLPATGHNYGKKEVVEATCTAPGYTKYTCTNDGCDASYVTDETDIAEHVIKATETVKATCTTDGSVTYACANCDYEFVEVLPASGHNYGKKEVVEATCTAPGYTKFTCTNDGCDASYVTDETDIAEHVIKATDTVKATCTTDGSVTYACANCDYKFVEVLPATGHNYGKKEVVEATCTAPGYTKYTCTNDGCDASYVTDETDIAEHVIKATETVKATCTTDGSVTYACANCDYEFVEVLPASGHNYGKKEVVEATCTAPGYTKYTCTNDGCDASYVTDETDIAEHVIKATDTVKATCTTDGSVTYACANCDYKFVEVLPATGHNYGKKEVVEATCTAPGYTKYTCTNDGCDASYVTDETDVAEHVITLIDSVAPTCTKEGYKMYSCVNCGYVLTETIPATGHSYGDAVTHSATCINKEYTEYKCVKCGEVKTYISNGSLGGHKTVTTVTAKATTKKDGKLATKCKICNNTISTTAIPAIKSVSLSYTSTPYTGGYKKPTVTVLDKKGKKISSKYYTVKYSNNKAIGKASVKVTFKDRYSGTVTKTFTIVPKGVGINAITTKNKSITIAYGKVANASGYQIQYSTKSNYSSKKSVSVTSNKTTKKTITGLKKGTKYYIRIRAYKVVNGTKYYGKWTNVTKTCK